MKTTEYQERALGRATGSLSVLNYPAILHPYFPTHLDALGPGLYPAFKRTLERRPA